MIRKINIILKKLSPGQLKRVYDFVKRIYINLKLKGNHDMYAVGDSLFLYSVIAFYKSIQIPS